MATSRYQLVDSLYGPGTVSAWLLTLCAIFISWTLNKSTRCKDSISLDFIGALLLPLVAAGHLIFQVSRLPYTAAETIISTDVEVQKYASALEAPLNICETFSVVSLLAAACCGPWWDGSPKLRRLAAVLVTASLSWGTENLMFAMVTLKGIRASDSTLSRPYCFLMKAIVGTTWGFLILCVLTGGMIWNIRMINIQRAQKSEADPETTRRPWLIPYYPKISRFGNNATEVTRDQMAQLKAADLDAKIPQDSLPVDPMSMLTMFLVPTSFIVAIFLMACLSFPGTEKSKAANLQQPFFLIPQSNGSMSSLDQISSLMGGILVLLWAIRAAYSSRKNTTKILQSVPRRRRSI
jgi:hypothetical protein